MQNFINKGFIKFSDHFDKKKCEKISNSLKNKINFKDLFNKKFSVIKFKKKIKVNNILDQYDIDFILNNKKFNYLLEKILGKDYFLIASRIICGVPVRFIPNWISKNLILNSPNLNQFIKNKYKFLRYFNGIDYHMDLIDFLNEKADFVTVYIYLDKVTKDMSPLILLEKSHYGGAQIFPHKIKKIKNGYIYIAGNKKIKTRKITLTGNSGDAWIWHGCLLHGSEFNYSQAPRFSLRLLFRKGQKKNKISNSLIDIVNKKIKNVTSGSKTSDYKKYLKFKKAKLISTRNNLISDS